MSMRDADASYMAMFGWCWCQSLHSSLWPDQSTSQSVYLAATFPPSSRVLKQGCSHYWALPGLKGKYRPNCLGRMVSKTGLSHWVVRQSKQAYCIGGQEGQPQQERVHIPHGTQPHGSKGYNVTERSTGSSHITQCRAVSWINKFSCNTVCTLYRRIGVDTADAYCGVASLWSLMGDHSGACLIL